MIFDRNETLAINRKYGEILFLTIQIACPPFAASLSYKLIFLILMCIQTLLVVYVTRYMKMYHKSGFELLCHAKPAK